MNNEEKKHLRLQREHDRAIAREIEEVLQNIPIRGNTGQMPKNLLGPIFGVKYLNKFGDYAQLQAERPIIQILRRYHISHHLCKLIQQLQKGGEVDTADLLRRLVTERY